MVSASAFDEPRLLGCVDLMTCRNTLNVFPILRSVPHTVDDPIGGNRLRLCREDRRGTVDRNSGAESTNADIAVCAPNGHIEHAIKSFMQIDRCLRAPLARRHIRAMEGV